VNGAEANRGVTQQRVRGAAARRGRRGPCVPGPRGLPCSRAVVV